MNGNYQSLGYCTGRLPDAGRIGAVYAWSVFRNPLTKQFGWSIAQVTWTFTICIFVLGVAAFFGGLWLNRKGPRVVALTAGVLYGLGVFLASFSADKLWWLYLSYGVIGGIGLGFGYIVPIAVLVKWFPDRRGLITGIAVGGFGAGALVTAPVAQRLIQSVGVLKTFAYLGVAYMIVIVAGGSLHEKPARRMGPAGLDSKRRANGAAGKGGLHARHSAGNLAMVGALALALSEYFGWNLAHLPGVADLSETDRRKRGRCSRHGGNRQHRQFGRPDLLGLDI